MESISTSTDKEIKNSASTERTVNIDDQEEVKGVSAENTKENVEKVAVAVVVERTYKWIGSISKAVQNIMHTLTHDDRYDNCNCNNTRDNASAVMRRNTGPRKVLYGTYSEEEHINRIKECIGIARSCKGKGGASCLEELGLEYRVVYCEVHKGEKEKEDASFPRMTEEEEKDLEEEKKSEIDGNTVVNGSSEVMIMKVGDGQVDEGQAAASSSSSSAVGGEFCHECCTRLFHIETDVAIDEDNRRWFIADGDMYEEITRLCQEVSQEKMEREGCLEWITICDDKSKGEPVRALVTRKDAPYLTGSSSRSKILIATGNGKVRAGIFSRQHLLITGIEASTALPIVREATRRGMSIVLLDPNARGDRQAMYSFQKTLDTLTDNTQLQTDPLYVLAHSAAGAQLVQYLNQTENTSLLQRIKAVAFTDSTHNIQWTKSNPQLQTLLQSENCLYFKSANAHRDADWKNTIAGQKVCTDHFWEHRFGRIQTLWAGTHEHSLTNWFARHHIWDHFDFVTPPTTANHHDSGQVEGDTVSSDLQSSSTHRIQWF